MRRLLAVSATAVAARPDAGVAVCLAGVPRFLESTAPVLRDNLFEPLDAEVLVYAPYFPRAAWSFRVALLGPRVVAIHREVENITARFRAAAPARWVKASAEIEGNWLGCWEDDSGLRREGSGMCLAYSWHRSLELLRRQEARRGRRYALLVQTRFDFVWGRPHPVAAEFPGEFLWVPEGNDWGGVNDRHAVMHRSVADAYLGSGWHDLLSGAAARQLRRRLGARRALNCTRHRGSDEEAPCATHELWLQLRLLARSVVVRRFEAHADIYRAESGMLECARGAALATNTDCLRRVAARAIRSLGIANSTTSQAKVWAKIERWCVLHRRDEAETRFLGGPPTHCEAVLVDMLMSEEARRRNRPCAEVTLEFVIAVNCDLPPAWGPPG